MDPQDTQTTETPAVAPTEETVTLTTAQLNARMAAARRDGQESAIRSKAPATPSGKPDVSALERQVEELKARQAFDRHTLGVVQDLAVADQLFKLYQVDKPESPSEWVKSMSSMFGIKRAETASPIATQSKEPAAPAFAPADSTARRVDVLSVGGVVDPGAITPEQRATMTPKDVRDMYEKAGAAARGRSGAPPRPNIGQKR